VFTSLTVFDNLMLAMKTDRGVFASLLHRLQGAERRHIEEVAERTGLEDALAEIAGALSHGQKQWLEIAMVILQDPTLFLVDEPAAGMTDEETYRTGEMLQGLAEDHSLIVIEHDMEFVRQIARTVTVLHEGKILVEGPMAEVQADPRVIECYLGTAMDRGESDAAC
jgi:urea transport system ATP-binding protein